MNFHKCSLALVKAFARTRPNVKKLEFGLWDYTDPSHDIFPTLVEVLAVYAEGLWPASLEVLYLRYWRLGCCTSFVEKLGTFPTSLKELDYQSGKGDQVVQCMHHLSKYTPKLETLSVCADFLRKDRRFSNFEQGFNTSPICLALSSLPMLQKLSFFYCDFETAVVDKILETVLFHTKIEDLAFHQPIGPGDDRIQTLRTYFRRPSSKFR